MKRLALLSALPAAVRGRLGAGDRGLVVRTDFESGSAERVTVLSSSHIRFHARADGSPRPLWFYFCLEGGAAPAVRCDLLNSDQCYGPPAGWATARPVFSADGRNWERVSRTTYVEGSGCFSFRVPMAGRATRVAYCYPYTTADLDALVRFLSGEAGFEAGELCRSAGGRPVWTLKSPTRDAPSQSVWIVARQHAGETPASFALEGFLRELARAPWNTALVGTQFCVAPMLDVDGVYRGRYGKDRPPVDFNRDWRDHSTRPEVSALIRAILETHRRAPVRLALDLHAPHHGDTAIYFFGAPGRAGEAPFDRQTHLMRVLAEEAPPELGFSAGDIRTDRRPQRSARQYLESRLGIPCLTAELSYHLARGGRYLTPLHYREFGAALLRAVIRLLSNCAFRSPAGPPGAQPGVHRFQC